MKIQESAENYLETILILNNKNGIVRAIDIANELEYTKASISIAMKNLRENGYIEVNEHSHISLTGKGVQIAEKMYERHKLISSWLIFLGVNERTATEDACKIEHVISEASFENIKKHMQNLMNK